MISSRLQSLILIASLVLLSGCATLHRANPADPYEDMNRMLYRVHTAADTVIRPVAQAYDNYVPLPIRQGVSNVFSNAGDLWIGINNLAQAKPVEAGSDVLRFTLNTTVGILGLFDVATDLGFEKHNEDLGQTLAVWGVGEGGYVFVPVIGPRTVRDALGWVGDFSGDALNIAIRPTGTQNIVLGARVVDIRAQLLPTDAILEEVTDDPYAYIRDAYLQRRAYLIHDGNPPSSPAE